MRLRGGLIIAGSRVTSPVATSKVSIVFFATLKRKTLGTSNEWLRLARDLRGTQTVLHPHVIPG
jgi:hypothetical protein